MANNAAGVFVTVDVVVPRLSGSTWEVALIQRKKAPFQGAWALPGGHLTTEDTSLEAAARRETLEETGLDIPLHLFQQVYTYEDFDDPRGKYVCLLYTLSEPLSQEAHIIAGDDASRVQWFPVDDLSTLPFLAFNHIRLLKAALRQFFLHYYHSVAGLRETEPCQCECEIAPGRRCPDTAYWIYDGMAVCPGHMRRQFKQNGKGQSVDLTSLRKI
ncbi:ADP-ribose pyrophosphatase YjhB (NUDIX family) [Thermosporothrix hazakensis]|jgi:8-oxo-dGTP diphosphatase|uniref:ADP-ribose pyrophosphatase YjhB (NUDIX family) n=1 Tax=Thermosporothrix hazakensis TaxID=644383 RepID=A0A326U3M5_THEHA|nr:NUDIX hydrolase [Thermosporothrix hazakensis]PZW18151.1 ADP-ribose pyrophosphatase YjhB (NUDIX family) [Thermosporothrix hazakensis]GCE45135.1 hypothetical protein KTH_00040 [Thermosporothrix hazakensis]